MHSQFDCLNYCSDLGKCCREFQLHINGKPVGYTPGDEPLFPAVMEQIQKEGLPFVIKLYNMESYELLFTCPELNNDGKCKIYEKRPDFCRNFQAKSDAILCCVKPTTTERILALIYKIVKRIFFIH